MTSNSEEIGAAGCSMDEEERRREEVKGSPHEVVGNNTAVGSGEERTPQSARQQGNESQVRGSHARRSTSLSALRRKNRRLAALRQERRSPIADTVIKGSHRRPHRRKEANTDTESSNDEVEDDEEESVTGSDSGSDSEELGAAFQSTQEAEMLRLITGDSESDGIGEEPFEVAPTHHPEPLPQLRLHPAP